MFERPPSPEDKLPVTLITGFLGSGKTTFINQLLENATDLRIAVLVNELGQIDIDGKLIRSKDKNKVELTNGCICCSINDSLMQSVVDILARRDTVDYLVVETTGGADPLPIMQTFLATELWSCTRLDAVIARMRCKGEGGRISGPTRKRAPSNEHIEPPPAATV